MAEIFNEWPEKYDQWFETPIGRLVKEYENKLVLDMLRPKHGDKILDAGCGTGIFTLVMLSGGASVVGLELSLPMLLRAAKKLAGYPFQVIQGDMRNLPFPAGEFDKTISVTAIEFIEDAKEAVDELFRVTQPKGRIVVATLNSLSPWAVRRKAAAERGHPIFKQAIFRSPDELQALSPVAGKIKTAVHFQKHDDPEQARMIEKNGQSKNLNTGAFLVASWEKP
jgi:ubiquinone/menaquinone biosynthesis C-methylase UbiE